MAGQRPTSSFASAHTPEWLDIRSYCCCALATACLDAHDNSPSTPKPPGASPDLPQRSSNSNTRRRGDRHNTTNVIVQTSALRRPCWLPTRRPRPDTSGSAPTHESHRAWKTVAGLVSSPKSPPASPRRSPPTNSALNDIGYSLPSQNWNYWNKGPGPGEEEWLNTNERDWTISTGKACASNLLALARALHTSPIPPPPGS